MSAERAPSGVRLCARCPRATGVGHKVRFLHGHHKFSESSPTNYAPGGGGGEEAGGGGGGGRRGRRVLSILRIERRSLKLRESKIRNRLE